MSKQLVIIKFGGSVITYKDQMPPKVRMREISSLIKQLVPIQKDYQIILIHGAGSFAHHYSTQYKLPEGIKDQSQVNGFSLTDSTLLKLHQIILKTMLHYSLSAIGLPPHSFVKKNNKILERIDLTLIRQFLVHDFIPVLYGDVVLDDVQGCAILSGDELVSYFAKYLGAKKVIFLSDVNGIYTENPKINPHASLISEVTKENFDQIFQSFKPHNVHDVTGEMYGKLKNIQEFLSNQEVIIANGFRKNILRDIFNDKVVGTKIMLN